MPMVSIPNLVSGGLNSDMNPVEVGENFFTHCNNVRMKSGGITPFGGHKDVVSTPDGKTPYYMKYVKTKDSDSWFVVCSDDVLLFTTAFTSVKPEGLVTTPDGEISITSLSGLPILNISSICPHYIDSAHPKFTPMPWDKNQNWKEAGQSCTVIATHKQFMFAMDLIDKGKEIPDGVRWSAPADVGAIPINWNPLDVTSPAGFTALGGTGGRIISALSMRDSLSIYRESGITIADYVGGSYLWRFRHLNSDVGIISKDSVVDVNGVHYFMAFGDICINDGNTVSSIASDRIKKIVSQINKHHYKKCYAIHNQENKEVWFCFPNTRATLCNVALIYNYNYKSWTVRDLPYVLSSDNGILPSPDSTWDNSHESWDGASKAWGDNATNPFDMVMLALAKVDDTHYKIVIVDIPIGFISSPYSSIIERTDLPLGGVWGANTITRVYPHVIGGSKMRIQMGSQMFPGGPVLWKEPVDFRPNVDRKVDIRTTGLLHAYRILASDVNSNFVLTGMDFEYTEAGRR